MTKQETFWNVERYRTKVLDFFQMKTNCDIELPVFFFIYCCSILEQGSAKVEAIRLDFSNVSEDYTFTDQQFRDLSNVRYLRLESASLSGNFHNLLAKLRWLSWHNSSFDVTATNLNLVNLVILNLSQTEVEDDWIGWSSVKVLQFNLPFLFPFKVLMLSD